MEDLDGCRYVQLHIHIFMDREQTKLLVLKTILVTKLHTFCHKKVYSNFSVYLVLDTFANSEFLVTGIRLCPVHK